MSYLTTWFTTELNKEIIEILEEDIKRWNSWCEQSTRIDHDLDKLFANTSDLDKQRGSIREILRRISEFVNKDEFKKV